MEIKPYNPRDWKSHPPYRFEGYASSMKRAPLQRLVKMKQTLSEITGPLFGPEAVQPGDTDLTRNAGTDGEAMGRACDYRRSGFGRRPAARAQHVDRDLAGQRRRSLPSRGGSAPRAVGSQLYRSRALHDQRARRIQIPHG